jgi:hypothetical protein
VSISAKDLPRSAPYKLLFRGAPVPLTAGAAELQANFTAPGDGWLSEDLDALAFEIETPCGPSVFRYRTIVGGDAESAAKHLRAQEKSFRPSGAPVSLGVWRSFGPAATLRVHVDRREAADKEVAIGKQVLRPGAGIPLPPYIKPDPGLTGDVYEIAAPDCAEGKVVRVAGEKVGEVGEGGKRVHALIDVKGGHCYEEVALSYSSLPRADLPFLRPKSKRISGKRVHVFGDGPDPEATEKLLAGCPSTTSNRSSCTYVVPTACDAP